MKKTLKKHFALLATALTFGSIATTAVAPVVSAQVKLPEVVEHEGEAIEGGTLRYALVGDPFSGILNALLYENAVDNTIISFFNDGLFDYDADFNLTQTGFATWEFDKDAKQMTIKIKEGHKWSDGEPITIDDVIFPYYVIGHKDYPGVRYSEDFKNVVGMEEYHEGKADTISDLERVDDYTLRVTYKEVSPSILIAGGGVSSYIEPKHVFEGVEVKDMLDHEAVRTKPVGMGAFKLESIVPGESVKFVANEYYWRGKPKIDGVDVEVVPPATSVEEMKAGNYDVASLGADQYDTYQDATNFTILGRVQNVVTYLGFKLGKWVDDHVEMDDTKVVANKALRKALAHAVNNDAVGEKFYHGLRMRANVWITPNFTDAHAGDIEGYTYDPEKSKALLAEAGFVDKDGDGFVEDPSGNPFVLKYAGMSGSEIAEPLAQYYIDSFKAVGVNVELLDGRLMELNTFYERVGKDDPEIDIYQAAFGLGGDPEPSGLFARDAQFNYSRFASDENDRLMKEILSEKSFDLEFKKQAFHDWQAYMNEELPVIPLLYRQGITAVNKRVKNYSIDPNTPIYWNEVELTADSPIAQ